MSSTSRDRLHLLILSAFAVAQPLFSLLSNEADFFVIRRSESIDILVMALGLMLLVPLPMVLVEAIAGLLGAKARWAVHLFFVGMLVSIIFLPYLKRLQWSGPVAVSSALVVGFLVTAFYARKELFRGFMSYLAPVLLIFPLMFLGSTSIRSLLFPPELEPGPVSTQEMKGSLVMVVFDELPSTALLDEHHQIDQARYPNLAALAAVSTWYPNAMASSDSTHRLLPALLTGQSPRQLHPTAHNYPQNLFTLLGGTVELVVSESTSQLCPPTLCESDQGSFRQRIESLMSDVGIVYLHVLLPEDLTRRLPPVTDNWGNFAQQVVPGPWEKNGRYRQAVAIDRPYRFERFLDAIDSAGRPGVFYTQSLLPHIPYSYLPSGRRYNFLYRPRGLGTNRRWSSDQDRIDRDYQLFLLQVGYVDTLVGKLVERLRRLDLFESSLLVITADHGASFQAGLPRRRLQKLNAAEILPIPLLIKAPHQFQSTVDHRLVQTIDVLPTVAELLGLQIPWGMDGLSAAGSDWPPDRRVRATTALHERWHENEFSLEDLEWRYDLLARRLEQFGTGYGREFWAFGPHRDLIGTRPKKRDLKRADWLEVTIETPAEVLNLRADADFVPAFLEGGLRSNRRLEGTPFLAIGVNDMIRAVVPVDRIPSGGNWRRWSAVVPEESFQPGENRVRIFLLRERNRRMQFVEAQVRFESL